MERLVQTNDRGYILMPTDDTELRQYALNVSKKLKEHEDEVEQGLLLKLPFSKDTPVYHIENKEVVERKLEQVVIALWLRETTDKDLGGISFGRNAICVHMDDIGKTVFLTQAEAEQKLKEMEGQ